MAKAQNLLEVTLEPFRLPDPGDRRFQRQVGDISALVNQESSWLNQSYYSGTVRRYVDRRQASKSVERMARSDDLEVCVVRIGRIARGLGTIIFDQWVEHPDEGDIHGHDLDYWVIPGLSMKVHRNVAAAIIGEAARIKPNSNLIATVELNSPNSSTGFLHHMNLVGISAELRPIGKDVFDIAKIGRSVQLLQLRPDHPSGNVPPT